MRQTVHALFQGIALLATAYFLIATSCSGKDWICECEYTFTNPDGTYIYVDETLIQNQTKKHASNICARIEEEERTRIAQWLDQGGNTNVSYDVSCTIERRYP